MAKPVTLPPLGPAIEEALLIKWLVPLGAFVKRGEPLVSVETDKTITDVESPEDGYLLEVSAEEGATVRVDQVLAKIGDQPSTPRPSETTPPVTQAPPPEPPTPAPVAAPETTSGALMARDISVPAQFTATEARLRASPRARRIARETGIPLEQLVGSGPEGRILQRDVAGFVTSAVAGHTDSGTLARSIRRSGKSNDTPLSPMRRSIARRMTEAAQSAPVFFATTKIYSDNLVALRAQLARGRSIEISINDIVVKACGLALQQHRQLNSSFTGDGIRVHDDIDISIAVAIDDGLITPVVRNADMKSLTDIAAEIRTLARKAQASELAVSEYQGGSFTISNLGMFGVEAFTAILNPPQSAILAVGAIDREVYLDGGTPRDRGVFRVTLTSDHRVIDGALAARFLATLKTYLESPAVLLV